MQPHGPYFPLFRPSSQPGDLPPHPGPSYLTRSVERWPLAAGCTYVQRSRPLVDEYSSHITFPLFQFPVHSLLLIFYFQRPTSIMQPDSISISISISIETSFLLETKKENDRSSSLKHFAKNVAVGYNHKVSKKYPRMVSLVSWKESEDMHTKWRLVEDSRNKTASAPCMCFQHIAVNH